MIPLLIDTDPGVDDARAIMLAHAHPNAEIRALTTVAGNIGVEQATANACVLLDVLKAPSTETPIFRGAADALLGTKYDGVYYHGADGFGNNNFPASSRRVESEHAVNALIRLANAQPGELTLAAIGPLTNLALATRLDPDLPRKFKRLVVMGGAIRATGNNRHNPSTEFNAYTDPEAMAIVFVTWQDLWLVSWETTLQHQLTPEQVKQLMNVDTPRGRFWAQLTREGVERVTKRVGRPGLFLPDELALAIAVEPDIVNKSEHRYVTVELTGAHTRGQTTVDWFGATGNPPNVHVVLEINLNRFLELLLASIR
jgi:purine nucleosidase